MKDCVGSWQILSPPGHRIQYYLPKRQCQHSVGECHSAWVNFNFRLENWALPTRTSVHSSRQTQFKACRNYHLPAGIAKYTWLGQIPNFPFREYAILLGRDWSSGDRIQFHQAEDWNFLFGRLGSKLVDTIIFRLYDWTLFDWETFSTSNRRMPFFLGKIQLLAGELRSP